MDITGQNAKRVLLGAINVRTGHRTTMRRESMKQSGFQDFLRLLRRRYPGRPLWTLLNGASAHTAPKSKTLAKALGIELIWLPKQCPELNAMDHLWRHVKAGISVNYQYNTINEHVSPAENYVLNLSNKEAKTKAGIMSENFWLKSFLK